MVQHHNNPVFTCLQGHQQCQVYCPGELHAHMQLHDLWACVFPVGTIMMAFPFPALQTSSTLLLGGSAESPGTFVVVLQFVSAPINFR